MKINVYEDEYYPFYGLAKNKYFPSTEIELPGTTGRHIKRVMADFQAVQHYLYDRVRGASHEEAFYKEEA